ncbi:bifunctional lysylphosphatidylglycerol flippase/synthetase MprF [Meridianimarinicoccus aquatilis]|uniref:Phosphatidylglycerol lysyltransferase n=1 Tax=Meridianimarinicoccus aquatilis TaxID=2552766 RepID=A0A4R6ATR5_9RHOB|nr:bifunctional lysylphosphatidylglycerol flippase/synthetase MprF [Fluviibacterium aquatile]TDL87981.1 bifunctional lysylphosphatidylglycerol flippase/synthetase MprF [Fluviibacterium aquatile]
MPKILSQSLRNLVPIAFGIGLFGLGLYALNHLLAPVDPDVILDHIRNTPPHVLLLALCATAVGYTALLGYDWLALRFIGRKLPPRVVAFGGFLGYAFGNTIGVSVVSGGAVRYRIYSAFGLNAFEVTAVSTYIAMALGTGLTLIGLTALSFHPAIAVPYLPLSPSLISFTAAASVLVAVGAILWVSWSGISQKVWRFELSLPEPKSLGLQLLITLIDVAAAAFTLWILLPAGKPDFAAFVAIYSIAVMIGVASHVPGGIGVFETVVIGTLPASVPVGEAAAALLLFRFVYYLIPFGLGFVLVSLNEARMAGGWASKYLGRVTGPLRPAMESLNGVVPSLVAAAVFAFGVYLMLVSMIPSAAGKALQDGDLAATILLEGGTLVSAMAGGLLLILSHGLVRRIEAAFWLTLATMTGGVVASMLHGLNYESALLLALGITSLLPFRSAFYRQAKLTSGVFSASWLFVVFSVLLGVSSFFFLIHQTTPYSTDLWTEFSPDSATPRSLRAGLAASALLLFFAVYIALRPARQPRPIAGGANGLDRAARLLADVDAPQACLAMTGDKQFVFSEQGGAFIMYAVQGRTWVALGDPVGNPNEIEELCWSFVEKAQRAGGRAVFYETGQRHLPRLVEMGLALHKIGEEAVVHLPGFSLAGAKFKSMRAAYNKRCRQGTTLEIMSPPHSADLLGELETISNAWLTGKTGREKRFSVGRFDTEYLNRSPIAVIRSGDQVLAFANILAPGDGRNVAIDLMRYLPDEASGIMEFMFVSLIEHYRDAGAAEFSLGMAPLAGLSERSIERLWNRFGRLLYRHGGAFYNFTGLRAFKQKFRPEWRSRYIAVPPGLSPTHAMFEVALLISGGAPGLLSK